MTALAQRLKDRCLGQYPLYFMSNGLKFLLATGYGKLISGIPTPNFLQDWIFVTLKNRWMR